MSLHVTVKAKDGRNVRVTSQQAQAIQELTNTVKGGCASVLGYRPTTGYDVSPVQDIQMITHFSTERLYERRLEALKNIRISDIPASKLLNDSKLSQLSINEINDLFMVRRQRMISSLEKSLSGNRNDAYRQAHDRCYAYLGDVKVHLKTEDGPDGKKVPVKDTDGNVFCDRIMIPYLELNVTVREEGIRKVVDSGEGVRMENLIGKCLNQRSVGYKTLSLKEDNFESLRIDNREFLPEHIQSFGDILET